MAITNLSYDVILFETGEEEPWEFTYFPEEELHEAYALIDSGLQSSLLENLPESFFNNLLSFLGEHLLEQLREILHFDSFMEQFLIVLFHEEIETQLDLSASLQREATRAVRNQLFDDLGFEHAAEVDLAPDFADHFVSPAQYFYIHPTLVTA